MSSTHVIHLFFSANSKFVGDINRKANFDYRHNEIALYIVQPVMPDQILKDKVYGQVPEGHNRCARVSRTILQEQAKLISMLRHSASPSTQCDEDQSIPSQ
jgi:hypothetical protein